MKKILILYTGNSCRSQIAHGYLKTYLEDLAEVYSAGIESHGVNSTSIEVMKQEGIDISTHTSNHIEEYKNIEFDFILNVCDHAKEKMTFILR